MKTLISAVAATLTVLALAPMSYGQMSQGGQGEGQNNQRREQMMQELAAACSGKAVDEPCSITMRGRSVEGVCRGGRGGHEQLICRPAHAQGQGRMGGNGMGQRGGGMGGGYGGMGGGDGGGYGGSNN